MLLICHFLSESFGANGNQELEFAKFNLPKGFDDDTNFDKSGFIPEMDFSHFFQRVDFDRSLNGVFGSPSPQPKASRIEETIGKKIVISNSTRKVHIMYDVSYYIS